LGRVRVSWPSRVGVKAFVPAGRLERRELEYQRTIRRRDERRKRRRRRRRRRKEEEN